MQMQEEAIQEITLQSYTDILEGLVEKSSIDLGDGIVTTGDHPDHGPVTLVNQSSGRCAIVRN